MSWRLPLVLLIIQILFFIPAVRAIEVDMSRRIKPKTITDNPTTDESVKKQPKLDEFVKRVHKEIAVDRQEVVILNTGKGFIPANVRLRKGQHYMIHVVNVNKENKNVSFMLDAFDQHYSTYFGEAKSFPLDPDKEGVFDYQCPETSAEGKVVVYGPIAEPAQVDRKTANTPEE